MEFFAILGGGGCSSRVYAAWRPQDYGGLEGPPALGQLDRARPTNARALTSSYRILNTVLPGLATALQRVRPRGISPDAERRQRGPPVSLAQKNLPVLTPLAIDPGTRFRTSTITNRNIAWW